MYRLIALLSLSLFIGSCATSSPVNKISKSEIVFNGGVYKNLEWDDKLVFKRTSWHYEAKLNYDLLITKLDFNSPFANWLEGGKESLKERCKELYIGIVYASYSASSTAAALKNEVAENGFSRVSLAPFKIQIAAHHVFKGWNLYSHKVIGFCRETESMNSSKIMVTMPGFKETNILE